MEREPAIKHFIAIDGVPTSFLLGCIERAQDFIEPHNASKYSERLRGKTLISCFYEPSTRTRASFDVAATRLGCALVHINGANSSSQKGESLQDTARTLEAMRPNAVVLRHPASGACHCIAPLLKCALINAGDGMHAHPTQALLDCATILRHKGSIQGLEVCILGDVLHSRVARSGIAALLRLGAKVRVCGPPTLMPPASSLPDVPYVADLKQAVQGCDVIMVLRLQRERQLRGLIPSVQDYHRCFGLQSHHLRHAKPNVIVMHPGPVNRAVEIDPALVEGEHSVILDQVAMGVALRMAVLEMLMHP